MFSSSEHAFSLIYVVKRINVVKKKKPIMLLKKEFVNIIDNSDDF